MTRAIVTTPFAGVPDGQAMPVHFKAGDEVVGDLAAVAVREGWAAPDGAPAVSAPAPAATPRRGRGKR